MDRNLEENAILRLADCWSIARSRGLLITGPIGGGRSYIRSGLDQQACRHGYAATYLPTSRLFNGNEAAKADSTHLTHLARIMKNKLLPIDDFGVVSSILRTFLLGPRGTVPVNQPPP